MKDLTRRGFIKTSALVGGSALVGSQVPWALSLAQKAEEGYLSPVVKYELAKPENILYSVCLQCNTGCGIKVKILDGVAAKIDGNPYNPWTMTPHLPYQTSPDKIATVDGLLCPKGQAGIQASYDPYRLRRVLKRDGPRGSDRWVSIPFDQAIEEIANGGNLFKNVSGEENRHVSGLKEIWALRDAKIAKTMAGDIDKIKKKELTVSDFKAKHKKYLDLLIDPNHPDLGPKNNQFLFFYGRLKHGRSEFIKRFVNDGFGSTNVHGHTTVCQGSLYFTGKAMSQQFQLDKKNGKMKWGGGKKFYWQAETGNSEFIIFVGASPFEANYGPPLRANKIAHNMSKGTLKYAVVDPRFSKTAARAWRWIPAKPGTEGALGLALIRWVIENRRYNEKYLVNANKAAAKADGEPNWTNASWLVKIKDGKPEGFLRASEIGLPKEKRSFTDKKSGQKKSYEFDPLIVLVNGKPVPFDPNDEKKAVEGELLVDRELRGIKVKSGLQILWESASSHTALEWAKICDADPHVIEALAEEFTSHGRKAAADLHRGASQHTNGFYNVFVWFSLNLLIGNYDWKGGMCKSTAYDSSGGKKGQPFPVTKLMPHKTKKFGVNIIRHSDKYEESTLFSGYPAKRPWYPLSSDIYQEIIPSAGDAYPYPIKAMFLYMGSPIYSVPAGHPSIEVLTDLKKVPLFVAMDIVVGESSMYADYIFPDLSYLERWEFQGSHPSVPHNAQPVRQPVIAPIPEKAKVFGREIPISLEALLLGLAEKLKLPGFGKDGFGPGQDFYVPEDLYMRMVANVAAGHKPGQQVPEADAKEIELFLKSRRHLPRSVFDPDHWRKAVGEAWWKRVVYVLNRGGRFDNYSKGYEGELLKNRYGKLINLYQEKTAKTKDSMTGKPLPGVAVYRPAGTDALGRVIRDGREYNLLLITHREISHTKSRTVSNYWLLSLLADNGILINKKDADKLGVRDGDEVKVVSASNPEGVWDLKNGKKVPMVGKARVIQGIRPGVISFSLGAGHWAYGAADIVIDGKRIKGDSRRAKGIHANAAFRVDPHLKNIGLSDLVGGSAVFYDTKVKLVRV